VVRLDTTGQPLLCYYEVRVGGEVARVELADLVVLRDLKLDPPRRLLFGGRLARVSREKGGLWVVHFEPDSGVLLTDAGAAAALCLGPPDRELQDVLRHQEEWLQGRQGP
jgi:hypothetical protein